MKVFEAFSQFAVFGREDYMERRRKCKSKLQNLKLLQKREIRVLEVSDIIDPILDHHETIESESEGKSGIFFRIDTSLPEDIRMHESSTEELYPSAFFTDFTSGSITERTREIHFDSRFDEWEISRSHTDGNFSTEDIREHGAKRVFEIGESDMFIDDHSFHLIECIFMGRIDILITENSSGDNCLHRYSLGFHDDILHTGGLCRENIPSSLEPEGILHIASRMCLWDIERVEIPVLGCDLIGLITIKSHTLERVLNLHEGTGNRMEMMSCIRRYRDGHIFEFALQFLGDLGLFDFGYPLVKSREYLDFHIIAEFPDGLFLFGRQILDSFKNLGQGAVFTGDSIAVIDNILLYSKSQNLRQNFRFKCIEFLLHRKLFKYILFLLKIPYHCSQYDYSQYYYS